MPTAHSWSRECHQARDERPRTRRTTRHPEVNVSCTALRRRTTRRDRHSPRWPGGRATPGGSGTGRAAPGRTPSTAGPISHRDHVHTALPSLCIFGVRAESRVPGGNAHDVARTCPPRHRRWPRRGVDSFCSLMSQGKGVPADLPRLFWVGGTRHTPRTTRSLLRAQVDPSPHVQPPRAPSSCLLATPHSWGHTSQRGGHPRHGPSGQGILGSQVLRGLGPALG